LPTLLQEILLTKESQVYILILILILISYIKRVHLLRDANIAIGSLRPCVDLVIR